MPMLQSRPILLSASFDAKSKDPNPMDVETPQKQIAFPTLFQTEAKSPP